MRCRRRRRAEVPGSPFAVLLFFIAADNLFWRVAGLIASFTFVRVTGDIRADLFRHLTGHAPSYFAKRMPGMLTSRVTATSNAVFTIENMFVWNVAPPCLATVGAIAFLAMVNGWMAGFLGCCLLRHDCRYFLHRRRRQTVAPRLRRQSRGGRWRNGGRHRQYLAGESVRRPLARATPLRRDRGAGATSSPPQPALSGEAAADARPRHRHLDSWFACLGDPSLATRARRPLATSSWSARWASRCSARRAISPSRWSTSRNTSLVCPKRLSRCSLRTNSRIIRKRPLLRRRAARASSSSNQLRLSRGPASLRRVHSRRRTWSESRPGRAVRRRQVHSHCAPAEISTICRAAAS